MTNPGNAIGTNGAFGGRTSPNALNDVLSAFPDKGVVSGWGCAPAGGLSVSLGGNGVNRDVAVAMDDVGNKITINNISENPISITLPAVPTVGQRIDSIVAYVNNPPQGSSTEIDNPAACGIVVVSGGAVAQNPTSPVDSDIRSAISADGASGTTAYYVILAEIQVAAGMTDITANRITAMPTGIPCRLA